MIKTKKLKLLEPQSINKCVHNALQYKSNNTIETLLVKRAPWLVHMSSLQEENNNYIKKVAYIIKTLPDDIIGPFFCYFVQSSYTMASKDNWSYLDIAFRAIMNRDPRRLSCLEHYPQIHKAILDYFVSVLTLPYKDIEKHCTTDPLFSYEKLLLLFVLGKECPALRKLAQDIFTKIYTSAFAHFYPDYCHIYSWLDAVFSNLARMKIEEQTIIDFLYAVPEKYDFVVLEGLKNFVKWGNKEKLLDWMIFRGHDYYRYEIFNMFARVVTLYLLDWWDLLRYYKYDILGRMPLNDYRSCQAGGEMLMLYFAMNEFTDEDVHSIVTMLADSKYWSGLKYIISCILLYSCWQDDYKLMNSIAEDTRIESYCGIMIPKIGIFVIAGAILQLCQFLREVPAGALSPVLLERIRNFIVNKIAAIDGSNASAINKLTRAETIISALI